MKKKPVYIITIIVFFNINFLYPQNSYLPISNSANFYYEDIIYNEINNFHTSIKPYFIKEIKYKTKTDSLLITKNSSYFLNSHLIKKESENFNININPVLNSIYSVGSNFNYSLFSGGAVLNSDIGKKLSLNINYFINAAQFEHRISERIENYSIIPHFGKYFQKSGDFYLFNSFSGYVSYSPSEYINFQAGKDKSFFGDGYRSLLLSSNSNSIPFVKASVSIWKIKYIVLYQIMKDINSDIAYYSPYSTYISPYYSDNNYSLEQKYATSHYLSWNLSGFLNLNLFETVIWRGSDSLGFRGYDINYLNPIIFFRPVEFSLGSPDNVIMGGGIKLKIAKKNHFYGQFILDEFKLSEIKAKSGWWGNKYGFQFGIKSFGLFKIKGLYLQAEFNYVRPFTYSHGNSLENYGNYMQAVAHPLGANFEESVFIIKYRKKRSVFSLKTIFAKYGTDADSINVGQNIYRSYNDNRNEYGNYILQGCLNKQIIAEIKYSYLINPKWNLQFEIGFMYKKHTSDYSGIFLPYYGNINYQYIFAGLKTNIFNYDTDY